MFQNEGCLLEVFIMRLFNLTLSIYTTEINRVILTETQRKQREDGQIEQRGGNDNLIVKDRRHFSLR